MMFHSLFLLIGTSLLIAHSHAFKFEGIQNAVKNAQENPTSAGLMDAAAQGLKDMEVGGSIGEAINFLKDPDIVATTKKALEALQSGPVLDIVLDNSQYFLDQMEKSGVVPQSIIDLYNKDKKQFTKDIKNAKTVVTDLFADPKAWTNFQEALNEPSKSLGMIGGDEMKEFQKSLQAILENPILKTLCQSDQLKSLLTNPSKWAETAQKFVGGEL